jgi:hypothetical protein
MSKDHNHGGKFDGPLDFRPPPGSTTPADDAHWFSHVTPPVSAPVVWRDQPEFLPIDGNESVRVASVTSVRLGVVGICLFIGGNPFDADAPYFAAWLDRLSIPWTEELRRAHDMWDSMQTKSDPCQDAPGGGMICTLSRGHALPHRGLWNGEIVRWNPPTHPDARAEEGS